MNDEVRLVTEKDFARICAPSGSSPVDAHAASEGAVLHILKTMRRLHGRDDARRVVSTAAVDRQIFLRTSTARRVVGAARVRQHTLFGGSHASDIAGALAVFVRGEGFVVIRSRT